MFSQISVVALLERFDESLALIGHELCWPKSELTYLPVSPMPSCHTPRGPRGGGGSRRSCAPVMHRTCLAPEQVNSARKSYKKASPEVGARLRELLRLDLTMYAEANSQLDLKIKQVTFSLPRLKHKHHTATQLMRAAVPILI